MASTFTITEVNQLLADMGKMDDVLKAVRPVVTKGATNIKNDWRKRWTGHPHIPALPRAINFDVAELGYRLSAEIGPDKDRPQGPLGNVIEYGTSKNAPIPGGAPALAAESPRFEKAIAEAAEKLLPQ